MANGVKEMQFIQEKIDFIRVKIVIDDKYYNHRIGEKIIKEMTYRFGGNCKILLEPVDLIAREASGKKSLVKNLLNDRRSLQ